MDDYPWANKFIYGCLFMFLKRNFIWAKVHQMTVRIWVVDLIWI